MDKKTAIIVGVIILVLTSIVTPFVLRKITDKTNDISQGMQVGETNKQNESGEIQEDKVFSGERISNEEIQESGDESEEQKPTEISGEQKKEEQESGESTTEYKSTSSQGATNQTTQSTEEKNNVPTNVDEEIIEENVQNIEVIEVVQNEIVNQEVQTPPEQQEVIEETEQSSIVVPEGAVGILKIDKINLCQKVAEGHSLEVLKTDLGHVDETAYYKGNIGILGHNNGNAGYFKRLTELAINDEIQYITENGTMRYKVSEITEIEDTDWSKLSKTEDNRITLITCVRNVPNKRYCVQAVEI